MPTRMDFVSEDNAQSLRLFHIAADSGQRIGTLYFSLTGIPGPPAVQVPFRPGSKTMYAGAEFELGSVTDIRPNYNRFGPPITDVYDVWLNYFPGGLWRMPVGWWNQTPRPITFKLSALDAKGKPIEYVDGNGDPSTKQQFDRENPKGYFEWQPGKFPNARPAVVSCQFSANATVAMAYTNIAPKNIRSLRVQLLYERPVQLPGFPLDPES
jgi:hypothetical protein